MQTPAGIGVPVRAAARQTVIGCELPPISLETVFSGEEGAEVWL
jgi:hypothetical protein